MHKKIAIVLLTTLIINLGFSKDINKDLFYISDILFKTKNSNALSKASLEGIISLDYNRNRLDRKDSEVKLILRNIESGERQSLDFFNLLNTDNILDGLASFAGSKTVDADGQTLLLKKIVVKDDLNDPYDRDNYELSFLKARENGKTYIVLEFNFINKRRKTFPSIYIEEKNINILTEGLNKLKDTQYVKERL